MYQAEGGHLTLSQLINSSAAYYDGFGLSLALSALTLVAGTPYATVSGIASGGGAVVYRRATTASPFVAEAVLSPPPWYALSAFDSCGLAVATVTDDMVAMGCRVSGGRVGGGTVLVFARRVTGTSAQWSFHQLLSPQPSAQPSFFASALSAAGGVLAVGAPYYQTDYVPWPLLSAAPGTAEAYATVSLVDDGSAYAVGATLSSTDARNLSSLWSVGSGATVVAAGYASGTCNVSTGQAVSVAPGGSLRTAAMVMPAGATVTMTVQACGSVASAAAAARVTAEYSNGTSAVVYTLGTGAWTAPATVTFGVGGA